MELRCLIPKRGGRGAGTCPSVQEKAMRGHEPPATMSTPVTVFASTARTSFSSPELIGTAMRFRSVKGFAAEGHRLVCRGRKWGG
eukprot:3007702-Rhodomonas_salina.2